eukprot:1158508-Pelagomonas_calceolata.AAC.14
MNASAICSIKSSTHTQLWRAGALHGDSHSRLTWATTDRCSATRPADHIFIQISSANLYLSTQHP